MSCQQADDEFLSGASFALGLFRLRIAPTWPGWLGMVLRRIPDQVGDLARRANAPVLLDGGWSCERVAAALFLNDDTVWGWHKPFLEDGRSDVL